MTTDKSMLIGQLIQVGETVPNILMRAGTHCLDCSAPQVESLEEACMVRGIDCGTLISQINKVLVVKGRLAFL